MAVSCSKEVPSDSIYNPNQVRLGVLNLAGIDVHTKAIDPVEDLDSFYAAASTGTAGSETLGFSSAIFTDPDGDGKYTGTPVWPNEPTDFNFYASNLPLTFTSGGMTVSATNGTDVVCAYSPDWAYKTECDMTFYHIFARLGDVTTVAVDDYTISGITINITPKTGGIYNLLTGNGYTNGTGWSSVTTASSASSVANSTVGTKENDIYMVPGTYLMSVSWTATKGDYTRSFGPADVSVPMTGGKINDVVFRIGGEAEEILFSVTVSDWGVNPIDKGTLEARQDIEPVDLGLSVKWAPYNVGASAPEEYGDYFSWGEIESKTDYGWSTYKWCNGTSSRMTKYCASSTYGTVDGILTLDSEDDVAQVCWGGSWHIPTRNNLLELRNNCSWTRTNLNGISGMLVTSNINGNSIFLPAAGTRSSTNFYSVGSEAIFWSCELNPSASTYAYSLSYSQYDQVSVYYKYRNQGFSIRPVCD